MNLAYFMTGSSPATSSMNSGQFAKRTVRCLIHYGLKAVEYDVVFRVPKNGIMRNNKPPAMRVEDKKLIAKITFPL